MSSTTGQYESDTLAEPRAPAPTRPVRGDEPPTAPGTPARTTGLPAPSTRRRGTVIGGFAVLAILILGGAWIWWAGRFEVSTDNAQVEGHVVPILPRVDGYVLEVRVDENQPVHAGDTLVVLDDRIARAHLLKAEADLAALLSTIGSDGQVGQAAAQLAAARADADAATAAVAQATAAADNAHSDLERYGPLAEDDIISRQQLDAARAKVATADAVLRAAEQRARAAEQQVIAAEAALRGADARVAAARAVRDEAALDVTYATIVAPVDGVASKTAVEIGQFVRAGQPLFSIVPLEDVWVVANLKETDILGVDADDPVEIHVDSYPDRAFSGHVESISAATGATFSLLPPNNATGNFIKVVQRIPVRIRLDAMQDPQALLRPGMSAEVTIQKR